MKKIFGNTGGLKSDPLRRLENLYRRRIPERRVVTAELARDISRVSDEIRRQIGLLVNRRGSIEAVIVGSHSGIVIPDTPDYRTVPGRLKGLRCVHTRFGDGEALTREDLTDLTLLQLDLMAVVTVGGDGLPVKVHVGHVLPDIASEAPYRLLPPMDPWRLDLDVRELVRALESEFDREQALYDAGTGGERALLVSVTTAPRREAADSMEELKELARSAGITIVDTVTQRRKQADPRLFIGTGKLGELVILALRRAASLVIFNEELNPSQIRSITDRIELKVIDRTQLILDIFAQRAQTREGKLQVELAQLKYLLPRLVAKNTAMSRLTGGIGGRGPGETKLEINRRRVRSRIARLEREIETVSRQRKLQKTQRRKRGLPVISIIGYTNAGKSTLLNTLTRSRVTAENRLFATLDPASRRLRFPQEMEVIITDTVGFIRNLPDDLLAAFRATFEELASADLLLHVIDASNPRFRDQIRSVEGILADLRLNHVPQIRVLNKMDRCGEEVGREVWEGLDALPVSALDRKTLLPLIEKMAGMLRAGLPGPPANCG